MEVRPQIRVVVADGQPFVRLAIAGIIERAPAHDLVGVAGNAGQLVPMLAAPLPDVLVAKPRCLSAAELTATEGSLTKTLLLSDRPARELLPFFLQGAIGIVSRQA